MKLWLIGLLNLILFSFAHAEVANKNSVMLGDRASGMGGAFTSLTDDPAASPYYNPATLARLKGTSLATAVSLFNKYDTNYESQPSLNDSIFRINRGSILSLPASSAIITNFHNFSAGLSIVMPDFQHVNGLIHATNSDSTYLRLDDQSLWVGGTFALNVTEQDSVGFSTYYTSQTTSRSLTNQYAAGGGTTVENEDLSLSTNSVIYQLGYFHEFPLTTDDSRWRIGLSYRFRSILVDGSGSYLFSSVSSTGGVASPVQANNLRAFSYVPDRVNFGLSCETSHHQIYALDLRLTGAQAYRNLEGLGDWIDEKATFNWAVGYENQWTPWLALRLGLFSDNSTAPSVSASPTHRELDHIDKLGFSANIGLRTTEHTRISLGGYYLGGSGQAAEKIGSSYSPVSKTDRVFSFLVGSSYWF
jgi:long-chain fatty acid transport protein